MNSPELQSGSGLVLVAPGGLADAAVAEPLAALLGLRLLAIPLEDPNHTLRDLGREPPGWLLPLSIDPGEALGDGGCWAEVLAAWRQATLLLLPAQAPAGAPRAYTALLHGAAVPLVGLVQCGGCWQPDVRRRDGLPWLGWLEPPEAAPVVSGTVIDDAAAQALRVACLRRWRELSAARPVQPVRHPPDAGGHPA